VSRRIDVEVPGWPMAGATRWGDLLVLSGLAAIDPVAMAPTAADFAGQARDVLAQLDDLLARGASSRAHVLRVECFLADCADFAPWNLTFSEAFGDHPPARTTLVSGLALPGLRIELQVLAGCVQDGSLR
jgi:2-iminobutanoate/2-iminopropanoate deaminase